MKTTFVTMVVGTMMGLGFLCVTPEAQARNANELLQKNACMACHSMDKKVLGPSFKDIAKKYKGNSNAVALLSKKVKDGGSGAWGPVPMPAQSKIAEADIKTMVEHILAQ